MKDKKPVKEENRKLSLGAITEGTFIPNDVDEVLNGVVKKLGGGAYVGVPVKHIGKKARIIIYKKEEEKKE